MKLISCHIDAFGKFKNIDFKFDNCMNAFCEKNGFGKTTLAVFIKAMFYSLPASSRKNIFKSERDLYKPFDYDGTFGGRLTFSCKKGTYIIVRQFGTTPTLDKFYLFDASSNLISEDFSSNLGEELFGVGKETFENSTFFGQQQLVSGINDDIRASLSTGVLSGDDIDNFEKGQLQLQKKLKEIRSEIKELKLDDLNADNDRYKAREEVVKIKLDKVDFELKNLIYTQIEMQKSNKIKNEKDASVFINRNVALESVVEANQDKIEEKTKQREKLLKNSKITKEEFNFLNKNEDVNKGHLANKTSFAMIFVALIGVVCLLCGGILKVNFLFYLGAVITLIALISIIMCLFVSRKFSDEMKKYDELMKKYDFNSKKLGDEIEQFKKVVGEIKFIDEDITNLKLEIEKNKFESKNLQKQFEMVFGSSLKNYYVNNDENNKKILNIDRQITELKTDKKHYLEEFDNLQEKLFDLNEKIAFNNEREQDLIANANIIGKVAMYLEKARDAISNRFIDPVTYRFNKYYKQFIKQGDDIVIDSNLGLRFGNKFSEVDFLSAGLYDLVFICKRFALVDLLFKKEKPVLILDDPFANFDDEKLMIAKEILEQIKTEYQVVMFTCQKSRT